MNRLYIAFNYSVYPVWLEKVFIKFGAGKIYNLMSVGLNSRINPRSNEYMEKLLSEYISADDMVMPITEVISKDAIHCCDSIVFVWNNGNGYGCFMGEIRIILAKNSKQRIFALNGRRRFFELSLIDWFTLLLRRNIERFWLGEIIFFIAFLLASPLYLIIDILRGKK